MLVCHDDSVSGGSAQVYPKLYVHRCRKVTYHDQLADGFGVFGPGLGKHLLGDMRVDGAKPEQIVPQSAFAHQLYRYWASDPTVRVAVFVYFVQFFGVLNLDNDLSVEGHEAK